MDQKINKSWEGSTEQFVDMAKAYAYAKNLISYEQEPNVRLVRDYVSRGIVSKPRKEGKEVIFGYRQLVEFLACRALINDGWPLKKIASDFQKSTIEEIKLIVPGETQENDSTKLIRKFTNKSTQYNEVEIEPLASKETDTQDMSSAVFNDDKTDLVGLWDTIPDKGKKRFIKLIGEKPTQTSIDKKSNNDEKRTSTFLKDALAALEKNKIIKNPQITDFNYRNKVAVDAYCFTEIVKNGIERTRLDLFIAKDMDHQLTKNVNPTLFLSMLKQFIESALGKEEDLPQGGLTNLLRRMKGFEQKDRHQSNEVFNEADKSTTELVYLIKNKDIDFIGLYFLTNGLWEGTKKSYRQKIAGISSGIQIWDHERLFGYPSKSNNIKNDISSETFERLRTRANEVTELNQLAKLLGNTSAGFSTEDLIKLNITKSINLQIGPSEMKSMTPKRAKAIARAIELSLILKKNREENTDD